FHTAPRIALIASICLSMIAGCLFLAFRKSTASIVLRKPGYLYLLALGIPGVIAIIASYTIFGIAVEYHPTLSTPWNRINYGAAIGATLFLLWPLAEIQSVLGRITDKRDFAKSVTLGLSIIFIAFFAAADWGFACPWIHSRSARLVVQKELLQYQ